MAEEQPFVDSTELSPWDGQTPLPYELSSLTWDADHYKNSQNCYCYCGKSKTQWTSMYKCSGCKQLFHIECLHAKPHHPTLPGDSSYEFKCGLCNNNNGNEHFLQTTKGWLDIVRVALYNLVQNEKRKGSAKRFFQHREELCRFMEKNWANLCADKTRTKTWENTVMSTMSTRLQYFQSGAEIFHAAGYWGPTSESDPSTFVINGTKTQKTESGGNTKKSKTPTNNLVADKKRKAELLGVEDQKVKTAPIKKQKAQTTVFIPRAKFDPVKWGYKRLCIATEHSSDSMKIGPDQMTVSHDLGYRMARASFGVTSGNWYFEVEALPHNGN
ncbi:metal-response element-binding transcription factor 2-like, partial [Planoprotostelium fungivorum]